jgi:predicted nucleic-acid-binding Zn-ribbon protein
MSRKLGAIARGVQAAAKGVAARMASRRFSVADKPVRCPHCGGETFEEGSALLNTRGLTFLNLDWANRDATTLVCTECGKVEWFLRTPEKRIA